MTYVPPKAKRQYIGALWKRNADGSRGALVTHKCAQCRGNHDSEKGGTWFERADLSGTWVWVCPVCMDERNARDEAQRTHSGQDI